MPHNKPTKEEMEAAYTAASLGPAAHKPNIVYTTEGVWVRQPDDTMKLTPWSEIPDDDDT